MGIQIQSTDITVSSARREFAIGPGYTFVEAPPNPPSECGLKVLDRLTCDGIHHLLVKAWIGFRRIQTRTNQQAWIFEIDGFVKPIVLAVVVDHRHALADRTGKEVFVLHFQCHFVSIESSVAGIEGVAL